MSQDQTTSDVPSHRHLQSSNFDSAEYEQYVKRVQDNFLDNLKLSNMPGHYGNPLFATNAKDKIWGVYLSGFPQETRQYHNCTTCRRFMQRYGSTVVVDAQTGQQKSSLFSLDIVRDDEKESIRRVLELLENARITGPFISCNATWGAAINGGNGVAWRHLSVTPPFKYPYVERNNKKLNEMLGELHTEFKMVSSRTLQEMPLAAVKQTLTLINTGAFEQARTKTGPLLWLSKLHEAIEQNPGQRRNLIWHAVVRAPAGFAHVRTQVIGQFVANLASGMAVEQAKQLFLDMIDPMTYRRPTAAPEDGQIERANEIVAELGLERSFARRIARPDEIKSFWTPPSPPNKEGASLSTDGFFDSLKKSSKEVQPITTSEPTVMTWEKFKEKILPQVHELELLPVQAFMPFVIFTTAVNEDAPPILQWDFVEKRNPVAFYCWMTKGTYGSTIVGSQPEQHNLRANQWTKVSSLTRAPAHWEDETKFTHVGKTDVLMLPEACESRFTNQAIPIANLRNELHSVSRTIEAYSNASTMEAASQGKHAVGMAACGGMQLRALIDGSVWVTYVIDRLE